MNKQSEISGLIDSQNPHILALTEFGAASDVNDGELGIEGYSLYRGNHSSGGGGLGKGVALYVKKTSITLPAQSSTMRDFIAQHGVGCCLQMARNCWSELCIGGRILQRRTTKNCLTF